MNKDDVKYLRRYWTEAYWETSGIVFVGREHENMCPPEKQCGNCQEFTESARLAGVGWCEAEKMPRFADDDGGWACEAFKPRKATEPTRIREVVIR